jgi:hypothetical protein
MLRRADWDMAAEMLGDVVQRDTTPATIATVLPLLRRIANTTAGTGPGLRLLTLLARVLMNAGRAEEAEGTMRDLIARAEQAGDLHLAWATSNDLGGLLWITGRPEAALSMAEQMADLTRRAGLEPWAQSANTRLRNEGRRLQFLGVLGRDAEVLPAVEALLPRIAALPYPDWDLREAMLDTGREAALGLGQELAALDFNAKILESRRRRGAPPLEQARVRFNDYAPLLHLGRFGEARVLLHNCRIVFERENDVAMLGKVLSALAHLENETANPTAALRFEAAALRYKYVAADLDGIMVGHLGLATYISKTQGPPARSWRTTSRQFSSMA